MEKVLLVLKAILSYFQNAILNPICIRCESFDIHQNYLCASCSDQFLFPKLSQKNRGLQTENVFYQIHYLIDWKPYESDTLSDLVYLLKKSRSFQAWQHLTKHFDLSSILNASAKGVIVPIPSSRMNGSSYHTRYFSQAVAERTGCPIVHGLLSFKGSKPQKKLNKDNRSKVAFLLDEEFTKSLVDYDTIILVDDVVTSGATLKAALSCLKKHTRTESQILILALFSRDII